MDAKGKLHFTATNAYSGNNGRATILNADDGVLYAAGNANPQPNGVILGAGAQILTPQVNPLVAQSPGLPTPVGSFNITELGDTPDKIGKDTNFRGLSIFNDVIYYTKGSGGNGVNTVYFVDTSGSNSNGNPLACPDGTGLPSASASLRTAPIQYDPSVLQTKGVFPYNMCVLNGFPTALSSKTSFPFGVWFADADTLYVADGNGTNTYDPGTNTYTAAAAQPTAGLQKWVFDGNKWNLAYTLTAGLNLGQPHTVPAYPSGNNFVTMLPWSPATDGLRNIIGRNNGDGTATIWAITSTVSGNGDQGQTPTNWSRLPTLSPQHRCPRPRRSARCKRPVLARSCAASRLHRGPASFGAQLLSPFLAQAAPAPPATLGIAAFTATAFRSPRCRPQSGNGACAGAVGRAAPLSSPGFARTLRGKNAAPVDRAPVSATTASAAGAR